MTQELTLDVEARGRRWSAQVPLDDSLTLVELCELLPGHRPEHSCMAGACGSCRLRVLDGADLIEPNAFGMDYSGVRKPGTVLACLAGVRPARAALLGPPCIRLRAEPDGRPAS